MKFYQVNNMKKFIKKNAFSFWFGVSLAWAGISFLDWKFYVVIIPTIILVSWKYNWE